MKSLCVECGWVRNNLEILVAVNPFDANDSIEGCPRCFTVNDLVGACDVDKCEELATCGFPTKTGYMLACGKHYDSENSRVEMLK